jgi:hypothetical protein
VGQKGSSKVSVGWQQSRTRGQQGSSRGEAECMALRAQQGSSRGEAECMALRAQQGSSRGEAECMAKAQQSNKRGQQGRRRGQQSDRIGTEGGGRVPVNRAVGQQKGAAEWQFWGRRVAKVVSRVSVLGQKGSRRGQQSGSIGAEE